MFFIHSKFIFTQTQKAFTNNFQFSFAFSNSNSSLASSQIFTTSSLKSTTGACRTTPNVKFGDCESKFCSIASSSWVQWCSFK